MLGQGRLAGQCPCRRAAVPLARAGLCGWAVVPVGLHREMCHCPLAALRTPAGACSW